jgi:hypothetical protein
VAAFVSVEPVVADDRDRKQAAEDAKVVLAAAAR